jgi:hypothetical protein
VTASSKQYGCIDDFVAFYDAVTASSMGAQLTLLHFMML